MFQWKSSFNNSKEEANLTFLKDGLKRDVLKIFRYQLFIMLWQELELIQIKTLNNSQQPINSMIPKSLVNSVRKEILIQLSLLTKEIQELVTMNLLTAPTKTAYIEFRLSTWFKECLLSFGREFCLQIMNIEKKLLTKLSAVPYPKVNNQNKLSLQFRHSWKQN